MPLIRRSLLRWLAALAPAALPAAAAATGEDPLLAPILARTKTPALAGAVVTPDGLAWLGAAGRRREDAPEPVTTADRWHIGSNAKAMTAALVARLVEQGRLDWDAPLAAVLPGTSVDAGWREVTLAHLLAHRGGLRDGDVLGMPRMLLAFADSRPAAAQRAELAARALGTPPGGPTGAFAYANANYVVAGAAIERLTGSPWEDTIRSELLLPLGMASAGFGAPPGPSPRGHRPRPLGLGTTVAGENDDNPPLLGPAGRIHLSLEDHARFVRLFLTDGGGFLRPASVRRLATPWPGPGDAYALGWGVREGRAWARGPLLVHEGSNTMWHALALVAPGRRLAILTVSNDHPRGADAVRALAEALVARHAAG